MKQRGLREPMRFRAHGGVEAAVLLGAALAGAAVAFVDARYAFSGALGVAVLLLALRFFRVRAGAPDTWAGWLYAAVLLGTTVTPALGSRGTLLRLGLAATCAVAWWGCAPNFKMKMPGPAAGGMALLLGALAIAVATGVGLSFSVARFVNWTMFLPILFLAFRRPAARGAAFGVVAAAVVQMVGVLLQALGIFGGTWGGLTLNVGEWLTRYTGFILNPNDLALLLALAVVVASAAVMGDLPGRLKGLLVGLIGVFLYGIILSGSRGGIVAVGLGIAALLLARGLRAFAVGAVFSGLAGAYLYTSTAIGVSRVVESLGEIVRGEDPSTLTRAQIWEVRSAGYDFLDFTFGRGLGGYAPGVFGQISGFDLPRQALVAGTVDNGWLKLVLECGVVGAVGLAAVLTTALWYGFVLSRRTGQALAGATSGACLVALLWRSTSVDLLDVNPWNAWIFLAAGLALAAGRGSRNDSARESVPRMVFL
jgi:hypothetical protein